MNQGSDAVRPTGTAASVKEAAKILGVTERTMWRYLSAGAPKLAKGGAYDVGAIYDWARENIDQTKVNSGGAVTGPIREARLRKLQVETRILELEEEAIKAELIPAGDAEALIRAALLPLRDALVGLPDALASQCNPADPEHARKELEGWRAATMRTLQRAVAEKGIR